MPAAIAARTRSRRRGHASRCCACARISPTRSCGTRRRKRRGWRNAASWSTSRSTPTWKPRCSRSRRCSTTSMPTRHRTCSRNAPRPLHWRSAMAESTPAITLIEAITQALAYEMRNDKAVVVLGEDVGVNGGVFRETAGLSATFGTERVLDTPLDETTIAGLTVGMASQGMKPVAEAQFDGFMYPMVDFIVCHAARMRYRTRGRLHCPMVLRVPWGGGIRAPEHHSEANEAIFTNVPGLRVVLPSSPARAYGLLLAAIRDPDPVIFMEPKRIYRQYKELVPDDGEALPLDVCYVLRDGTDVALVTWGAQVKECLEAAEKLAKDGISAEVIDVATLRPLDFATIAESVSRTGRCVIVHEAPKTAGFGAEIAARLAEESMFDLLAPVERVTGYDTHIPLFRLEMKYLPSVDRIITAAKRALAAD